MKFWLMRRVLGAWECVGEVEAERIAADAIVVSERDKSKYTMGDYLIEAPQSLAEALALDAKLPPRDPEPEQTIEDVTRGE